MERRKLGSAELDVPVLSFGTGTFGGSGPLFGAWGNSDAREASRLVDICLDAGANLFDTADAYSRGASEEVLGMAIRGRRQRLLIATKTGLPMSENAGDWGVSRSRLLGNVDASLNRLGTDYIDLLQLHAYDAATPVEELLECLEVLVSSGKVRHVGVSNYPGWALMKALAVADRDGRPRFAAHQVYYSLLDRAYEADLMPLGADQKVGALIWSPLGWGRLTGKVGRDRPLPRTSCLHQTASVAPPVDEAHLYRVIDALEVVAGEVGRSVPQVALNWLTRRPTVVSVIVGARNEEQLRDNLGAVGWTLTETQMKLLDEASYLAPSYPHSLYRQPAFARLNPPMVLTPTTSMRHRSA